MSPLLKGSSKAVIASNIREMVNSGHSEAQAIAACMRMAGKGKKQMKPKKQMMPMDDEEDDDDDE